MSLALLFRNSSETECTNICDYDAIRNNEPKHFKDQQQLKIKQAFISLYKTSRRHNLKHQLTHNVAGDVHKLQAHVRRLQFNMLVGRATKTAKQSTSSGSPDEKLPEQEAADRSHNHRRYHSQQISGAVHQAQTAKPIRVRDFSFCLFVCLFEQQCLTVKNSTKFLSS